MTDWILVILFIVFHLCCCCLIYIGIRSEVLYLEKVVMPLVIYVPVWGPLCVIFMDFYKSKKRDLKTIGLEKLRINEEVYRSILTEKDESADRVVSLEEALLINDPKDRRRLIMDILDDDPEAYIELLDKAKLNADPEVVHYATTALVELVKEFDHRLQKSEQAYADKPDDQSVLDEYCQFLKRYIDSGLLKGQMELVQRHQYAQLLEKKLNMKKSMNTFLNLAENYLVLKDYTEVEAALDQLEDYMPECEELWMLRIRACVQKRDGKRLQKILQEIEKRQIYFSAGNRRELEFWQ